MPTSDSEIPAAVVDFDAAGAPASADMSAAKDVQAGARRRNFHIGARAAVKDRLRPRLQNAIGQAVIKVNAGNPVAVEYETQAVADIAASGVGLNRPSRGVSCRSVLTRQGHRNLGAMANPARSADQIGRQTWPAMRGHPAAARTESGISSGGKCRATDFAGHGPILAQIRQFVRCNG